MIHEAYNNIFIYGNYINNCGSDVGLNMFDIQNTGSSSLKLKGTIDYYNKAGSEAIAEFYSHIKYSQIQRENNIAGKVEIKSNDIVYPENGALIDCGLGYRGVYSDSGWGADLSLSNEDAYFIPINDLKNYNYEDCEGSRNISKSASSRDYNFAITIYPLLFEVSGFYMEGEKRWANDMVEAIEYVLLHEWGHIEHHLYANLSHPRYPFLESGEEGADNFAFSVWRCKKY